MKRTIALVVVVASGCAANLGSESGRIEGPAAPELEVGLSTLVGPVEQNRRDRIAIFEGNALASRVFENAMNAELRVLGLDALVYLDHPMSLSEGARGELVGESLGDATDPTLPVGVPASAACPFAMPTPPVDASMVSCRFLVSAATDRARVRSSQALVEEPLYDELADEAPNPEEVRQWYAQALDFGIEAATPHALEALRSVGACDQEPTVVESAFERGVLVGRAAVLTSVASQQARTPRTECNVDRIVQQGVSGLDAASLADASPLCPGFEPSGTTDATYLAASTREYGAGIASGIAEASNQERARLVREWVCEIPQPPGGGDGGGGGGGSGDPLVLDLDGDGAHVEPLSRGAFFDYGGTGCVQTEWLSRTDGFLVLDRDGDGQIAASELFGDVTVTEDGARADDGLLALSLYDEPNRGGNGDGRIDAHDAIFSSLALWVDADGDARADVGEVRSLRDAGISAVDHEHQRFEASSGGGGAAVDVVFSWRR